MEFRTLDPKLLASLPRSQLQALVQSLEPLLKLTTSASGRKNGAAGTSKLRLDASEQMLEAALLFLNVVTVPEMPRQIFVEEMVEDALTLCKQQLSTLSEVVDTPSGPATPATSRRYSGNGRRALSGSELSHAGKLALVLERLPDLVSARCLNDSLILQLGHLSLNAAFGAPTLPLQVVGMEILLAIFVEYAVHRATLLAEMLDLRLQIADAAAREGRRAFALPDGARIQTFSALALLLIQNAAVLPGRRSDRPWSRMGGEASPAGALGSLPHPFRGAVTECASQLLRSLVSRCIERSDDTEAKALLDEFVRDMLLVLGRPEWPAAALLVTLLSTILCRRLEKKKLHRTPSDKLDAKGDKDELAARLFSLDLLGQILAALAAQRRMHAEAPLLFPADKEEVDVAAQPNDAGEDARCVCGHGYDGSFMLDCDKCHRWFHGECVGVKPNDDNIAREWYCDSCQLSRAVADQRRTITRLLSLADCGGEDGTQGSAAASEEAVNALCTEEEVTKQLLLNYLDAASSNPASSAAHRSLLCQWHFDAAERKEFVLCRLYEEQDAAHTERCRGPRELHSGRVRSLPLLTRDRILSATRRLLVGSPLLGRLETMIAYVLLVLKEPQPSARTKAIKAISGVVTADPSTLEMAGVKQAVHLALCEPSIAVREATLDLVGQYILSRPEFVPLYYEPIVRRLADVGISVRKRVVRILRELCLKDPSSKLAVDACRRLMARVCDEDEVQKLVVRVFYELWFMPPAVGDALTHEESGARCVHLVNVVAGATAQWSDWLRQLLLKLLTPPADGKGAKEYTSTLRVSSQLVAQLTEMLLQLHEQGAAEVQGIGSVLQALSLFCAAKPSLLVPHVELLPNYLQYDQYATVVHHVCEMLPKLLPMLDKPRKGLLEKLERLLGALVFRVPEQLLQHVIAALCCTVSQSHNYQLLHETLARLCQMMTRAKDPAQAERLRDQLHRSILCAGLLCRYFDFEAPGVGAAALDADGTLITCSGDFTRGIFDQLHGFLPFSEEADAPAPPAANSTVALYALKAIGHVCVRRHDVLIACRATTSAALRRGAPQQLRQQALASLQQLVRQPAAATQGVSKEAAHQATEASAAVSGTLQQHQAAVLEAMIDPQHSAVRREALQLIRAMLEQGLVHPMACIPQLMALELDTGGKGSSQLAREVLRKLYERHHQMVCSPGVAMQGMAAAYDLQAAISEGPQAAAASEASGDRSSPLPTPRFMYELMLPARKERLSYLKAVVGLLHPDQLHSAAASAWSGIVERAGWVARSLAGLPFEKEEDPLSLVFHINRQLSIHADGILQALARDIGELDEGDPLASAAAIELRGRVRASVGVEGADLSFERHSHAAALACLLLLLKRYVKQVYQLNAFKCRAFEPSDTSSAATGRLAVRIPNKPILDINILSLLPPRFRSEGAKPKRGKKPVSGGESDPPVAVAPVEGAARDVTRFLWLRELIEADEAELDHNLLNTSASTPRPPKPANGKDPSGSAKKHPRASTSGGRLAPKKSKSVRKRKSRGAVSEDEDGDDDDDDDAEYQPT